MRLRSFTSDMPAIIQITQWTFSNEFANAPRPDPNTSYFPKATILASSSPLQPLPVLLVVLVQMSLCPMKTGT